MFNSNNVDNELSKINQKSVTVTLHSETDTQALAERLAKLPLSGSVWLAGDLGAGKTTLTRYWLQALGHVGAVKSPTYTLVEPYSIQHSDGTVKPVYHADLYRLQDPEELSFIGFDEYLDEPDALVIIEWASRADSYLPPPTLFIDIIQGKNIQGDIIQSDIIQSDNGQVNKEIRQVELRLSKVGQAHGLDLSTLKA
ncbi:tRNA (adenosine(37)-N6)-threonylcarbamoyltransferase complex ATPase subunit type 1 TsaE [Psychrobacter frigidicola]|uniref:tRNA (adenosine(37)-N6)-threonylcarbamoyltransferase complex ATPase subunit type 1 TsaE n=1 Tax=Psychrobacter frigidicola TaxID=45611 RepID=UPI001918A8B0|nr:tRNA (adenosine(37)-N6)-threonylcarbamoyltransferase complex ATPase subunit type 1 TsaE [Psychrobacter frigidicola]